ncbi:DUF4328 domain-containing protein [Streptomyces argenteolus]|uniref:DUF4328 domain-containing protein n=1 Tax=Streptomyces argenteolus TaxID=67274 RepID=A0ABW6X153_9ACTN
MLCLTCGTRPVVTADGRCRGCAMLSRRAPGGLMPAASTPPGEGWHRLRSPGGLAKAVIVSLSAVIATDLLAVAVGLYYRGLLGDALTGDGSDLDDAEARGADLLYAEAGSLQMLAMLATAVLFIIWFHRVRRNAEVFDASRQPMRPGWAIGGWFVPLANFWLPRRIAGGIWSASAGTGPEGAGPPVSKAPLHLWWGFWVFSLLLTRYAGRVYEQAMTGREIVDAVTTTAVADVVDGVAAALAIVFVHKLTRMQRERMALGPASQALPQEGSPGSSGAAGPVKAPTGPAAP